MKKKLNKKEKIKNTESKIKKEFELDLDMSKLPELLIRRKALLDRLKYL